MSGADCFVAAMGNETFGVTGDPRTAAADAAALVMVGLVSVILLLVVLFAVSLRRRARKPDAARSFLDGLDREASATSPRGESSSAPAWEKPADWWNG